MNSKSNLNIIINKLYNNIRNYTFQEAKKHDLTSLQWQVINHIDTNNGILTQLELSELMQRDLGQLTRLLNKLEKNNLIRKATDKQDKRKKHIMLTRNAKNKIYLIREGISKHYAEQKNNLSEIEYNNLISLLSKIKLKTNSKINI